MAGKSFLTGLWLPTFSLPLLGSIHLGTPLIFDIGVYLTVFGFVSSVVFSLAEASLVRSDG
jgi:multicomponent Na+:H+ antiporter subunit B